MPGAPKPRASNWWCRRACSRWSLSVSAPRWRSGPANLPTSRKFGGSTTVHRVVLADAGLELFQQQPLFGIGWQQAPVEVGSPDGERGAAQALRLRRQS